MADIVISNVDEQVKQNFERFCANAGMNMAAAFSTLVKGNINEQGLLFEATDKIYRRQRTDRLKKIFAEAQEAESELTDEEWEEFANIRSKSDFDRGVEKWFTP